MLMRTGYDTIARPAGGFAMVAIDARESMRHIFRDVGRAHQDDDLVAFKRDVALELGGLASAVLCDPRFGADAMGVLRREHPDTGLIVAVDAFDEPRYGPLRDSSLDEAAIGRAVALGAVALKLYLFWRPHAEPAAKLDDARRFVDRCHELGVLSLIEGVVTGRHDRPEFDDTLVRAAEAFGSTRPDLYKTHLPTLGAASGDEITRQSERVSDAVGVPWVVLSNGVDDRRFLPAVEAACAGGASGVLAGRGVWREALTHADPVGELRTGGRARLEQLIAVVDAQARPWQAVVGT